jgi:glycerophosphoryl diester phosphodiesterase
MMIIAHRGAPAETVENTRAAFVAALRSGAHMVETDLRLTLDGQLVVHHDADTKRLMGTRLVIAREPLVRLRTLRYANGDELLSLTELLELIDGRVPINLELKARNSGRALLAFLAAQDYRGPLLVSSQHREELDAFRSHGLGVPLGPVANTLSAAIWSGLADHRWQFVSISRRGLQMNSIQRLQRHKVRVYVYTVNDPQEMLKLAAAGADGIFTDDPTLAMQVLSTAAN